MLLRETQETVTGGPVGRDEALGDVAFTSPCPCITLLPLLNVSSFSEPFPTVRGLAL